MTRLTLSSHFHSAEIDYVTKDLGLNGVKTGTDFHAAFELGGCIGHGNFAQVHLARHKATENIYACKIINKFAVSKIDQLRDEIRIMNAIDHNGIITLHEYYETEEEIFLILDLATGGELYKRLLAETRFNEVDTKHIVYSILEVCTYLHDMNVVHRDIKLENILLVSTASKTHVKVTDFGMSKILGSMQPDKRLRKSTSYCEKLVENRKRRRVRAYTQCGTDYYISPEILKGEGYCETVDMWSVGVVLYLLLTGRPPFSNEGSSISNKILAGEYDKANAAYQNASPEAKDLIAKLLTVDPEKRITSDEALSHQWFNC